MRTKKPATGTLHKLIENELQNLYRSKDRHIFRNHEYNYNGPHEADLIIVNYKRKCAIAIEVKTTNHKKARRHAYKQLAADEAYIKDKWSIDKVYKFYAHRPKRKSNKLYEIHYIK